MKSLDIQKTEPRQHPKHWLFWGFLVLSVVACLATGIMKVVDSENELSDFLEEALVQQRKKIRDDQILKEQEARRKKHTKQDARDRRKQQKWAKVILEASLEFHRSRVNSEDRIPVRSQYHVQAVLTASNINPISASISETDLSAPTKSNFWSFRPLQHVSPPVVYNNSWPRNPIDRFILKSLEQANLQPNREASPKILSRRLRYDLVGLPPSPKEHRFYISDKSPLKYERLVEELLSHPGFGERWGRLWLDLARYADSNGYEEDELRPNAYPYRDFVIWAMNEDLPFDLFVQWQIAGDELQSHNPLAVAATGFFTAGPYNTFFPQESERWDELDDMVSTMGNAMLGLSIGCARCHDHKYDPISNRDYYGLVAIFAETHRDQRYLVPDEGREYRRWADPVNERRDEIRKIRKARIKEDNISELDYFMEEQKNLLRAPIDPNNQEQIRLISLCERCLLIMDEQINRNIEPLPKDRQRFDQLMAEIKQLKPTLPPKPTVGLTLSGSNISQIHTLRGGNSKLKGDPVGPGFLTALIRENPTGQEDIWKKWDDRESEGQQPFPRSALARWMTDVEQGAGSLLARVIVNRLWQHHFGDGLVRSPSEFGNQGDAPTHPDLLEWLAWELVENNWSLKHIHRLIVNSATYRQSSSTTKRKADIDPDNLHFSRQNSRRLTAEMIRDTMLRIGGNLNRGMYGPGIKQPIPIEAVFHTQDDPEDTWPIHIDEDRPALWRRSIYLLNKRTIPIPMMQLFDAPVASYSCASRKVTTVPTQALAIWNAPFVRRQASRLAQRILADTNESTTQNNAAALKAAIRKLYLLTFSRQPTVDETRMALDFLNRNKGRHNVTQKTKNMTDLCHVMLMTNEFVYVD